MNNEWDLMKDLANASNNGRQDELAEIINSNCLAGMERAATIAVGGFELTDENIKLHSKAAIKLAKLKEPDSFREGLRHGLLVDRLSNLGMLTKK